MSTTAPTQRTPLPAALETELEEVFGDRFTTAEAMRRQHGEGESFHANEPPDAVVFPDSTAEVSAAVSACHRHGVPMIGFGAGTSLEGHVAALRGGGDDRHERPHAPHRPQPRGHGLPRRGGDDAQGAGAAP